MKKIILLLFIDLCSFFIANAQWTNDGTTLNSTADLHHRPIASATKDGGAYVTWVDTPVDTFLQSGSYYGDIFITAIDNFGNTQPGWYKGGINITNFPSAWAPIVITSEDGGAIVVWSGATVVNGPLLIQAQKYSESGIPLWNGGKPINISNGTNLNDEYPIPVSDQHDGFYVTWNRYDAYLNFASADIYMQHIDSTGHVAKGWQSVPTPVADKVDTTEYDPHLVLSNSGNALYVMYGQGYIGNTRMLLKKFNAYNGIEDADWTKTGMVLSYGPNVYPDIMKEDFLFTDNQDNVICFWNESRFTANGELYMQQADSTGKFHLNSNGLYIAGESAQGNGIDYIEIVKAEDGNFLIAYDNYDTTGENGEIPYDVGILKKAPDGTTIYGHYFATSNGWSAYPKAVSDGKKGMYVFYKNILNEPESLYAFAIDSLGNYYKNINIPGADFGIVSLYPMGMAAFPDLDFKAVANKPGQAIVVWNRQKNQSPYTFDIIACNLLNNGDICTSPVNGIHEVSNTDNILVFPNPFNSNINININPSVATSNSSLYFKMYDITGKIILQKQLTSAGFNEIPASALSNGTYFYNLYSDNTILKKGVLIKQ